MLHYDALRQMTVEHRLHHEAEAEVERVALQARDRRVWRARRLPLASELEQLRTASRHAMQRAGYVVVTVWPRR
jgi:hypothetical protein